MIYSVQSLEFHKLKENSLFISSSQVLPDTIDWSFHTKISDNHSKEYFQCLFLPMEPFLLFSKDQIDEQSNRNVCNTY